MIATPNIKQLKQPLGIVTTTYVANSGSKQSAFGAQYWEAAIVMVLIANADCLPPELRLPQEFLVLTKQTLCKQLILLKLFSRFKSILK